MKNKYTISRMSQAEAQLTIEWAAQEGWNPGLHDATCFYAADSHGFFAGRLNDTIIAVGTAIIYDVNFAFCGLYIVKPEFRNKKYGTELTKARLEYLGSRVTGIDGVLNMTEKYEQIGYKTAYTNARYQLNTIPKLSSHPQIVALASIDFMELLKYDRRYFPAPREAFLDAWIKQPDSCALGFVQDGNLLGYGVVRKCAVGAKIGPLFAETATIANHLFQALSSALNTTPIFLDIPELNAAAVQLVNDNKMHQVFATARMYRNGIPELNLNNIYGITTFELG